MPIRTGYCQQCGKPVTGILCMECRRKDTGRYKYIKNKRKWLNRGMKPEGDNK